MARIDELIRKARALKGFSVKAGVLRGATYPDTGQSVAQTAIWQEYGVPSRGIPARPFLRNTVLKRGKDWEEQLSRAASLAIRGSLSPEQVTTLIGGLMAADIRQTIKDGVAPPLSPVTVMTRYLAKVEGKPRTLSTVQEARQRVAAGAMPPSGDDTPLYDTHILYKAIDYE